MKRKPNTGRRSASEPDGPEPHYQLGIALGRQGKLGPAEAEYREAIRLKPDYADAYLNLGALLCDQKHDYEGAIAAFREAIRLQPDSPVTTATSAPPSVGRAS